MSEKASIAFGYDRMWHFAIGANLRMHALADDGAPL
jgi:hypothetical protein